MTKKASKITADHKFEIKSTDVELLADYFIAAANVIGIQPTYGDICRRVQTELNTKYPITRCSPETQKGIRKFVNEQIFKTYIWR